MVIARVGHTAGREDERVVSPMRAPARAVCAGAGGEAATHAGNEQHAEAEHAHIGLWDQFVRSVGGDTPAAPTESTAACVTAWADGRRDRAATLAVLYAIESAQPAISETKRAGLVRHYGAAPNTDATRYFDVHVSVDHAHAAEDRRELSSLVRPDNEARLLENVERALRGNWRLLDGCMHESRS